MTRRRLLIVLIDSALGSVIGPLNYFGLVMFVSLFATNQGPLVSVPTAFEVPAGTILRAGATLLVVPSFLATLVLAPFLSLLERRAAQPWRQFATTCAVAGILFGLVATFLTGFFMGLVVSVMSPESRHPIAAVSTAFYVSLFTGIFLNITCFPAICVSGPLFGLLNGWLVRQNS